MMVNQCVAINYRHGTGFMHMNSRHNPLSEKMTPLSQFAGYGPELGLVILACEATPLPKQAHPS